MLLLPRGGILTTYNHEQINISIIEYFDNATGSEDWTMEVTLFDSRLSTLWQIIG